MDATSACPLPGHCDDSRWKSLNDERSHGFERHARCPTDVNDFKVAGGDQLLGECATDRPKSGGLRDRQQDGRLIEERGLVHALPMRAMSTAKPKASAVRSVFRPVFRLMVWPIWSDHRRSRQTGTRPRSCSGDIACL